MKDTVVLELGPLYSLVTMAFSPKEQVSLHAKGAKQLLFELPFLSCKAVPLPCPVQGHHW